MLLQHKKTGHSDGCGPSVSLRVRVYNPRWPDGRVPIWEQVNIEDVAKARSMLATMGYQETLQLTKQRSIYFIDAFQITVDHLEGVGSFAELAVMTDDADALDEWKLRLLELARQLGLEHNNREYRSYRGLLCTDNAAAPVGIAEPHLLQLLFSDLVTVLHLFMAIYQWQLHVIQGTGASQQVELLEHEADLFPRKLASPAALREAASWPLIHSRSEVGFIAASKTPGVSCKILNME